MDDDQQIAFQHRRSLERLATKCVDCLEPWHCSGLPVCAPKSPSCTFWPAFLLMFKIDRDSQGDAPALNPSDTRCYRRCRLAVRLHECMASCAGQRQSLAPPAGLRDPRVPVHAVRLIPTHLGASLQRMSQAVISLIACRGSRRSHGPPAGLRCAAHIKLAVRVHPSMLKQLLLPALKPDLP